MVCIDLYHSRLLLFIEILIKVNPLQPVVPITLINLVSFREFGKILPNDFGKCSKLSIHYVFKW